jgi:putative ABC transport system substrate-binding protein
MPDLTRRQFMTILGGAAAGWPLAARAQRGERVRRIGALMPWVASDPQVQARYAAFLQGLQQLGWSVGNNVQIDSRWSAGKEEDTGKYAAELVALAPDVIFASGSATVGPLRSATRTVPIVFVIPPIRLARASSTVWRGRGEMPPVLHRGNTASVRNGWSCSSRSCQA